MTNAPTAMPGVSRQINPKRMPNRPRKPTAHQLSANTSLNASQRPQSGVDALPFAAMGRPPSLAINIGSQSLLTPKLKPNRLRGDRVANITADNHLKCSADFLQPE